MPLRTLISWNVNGIRAAERKGFLAWLAAGKYDLVNVQETKVSPDTELSSEIRQPAGYISYWDYAEKKGYSGVASYARNAWLPTSVKTDFGDNILSQEGRMIELDYGKVAVFNIYFPNGKSRPARLQHKMEFYKHFLAYVKKMRKAGKSVIICGDVNTAHTELDLARPKENSKISGFLPTERAWIDELVAAGFVDTFRMFEKGGGNYSWWDQKTAARERNVGWRIDYFFVSEDLKSKVKEAFILKNVMGSDHAPVGIKIEL